MNYVVSATLSIEASNTIDALATYCNVNYYYYDRTLDAIPNDVSEELLKKMLDENKTLKSMGYVDRFVLKVSSLFPNLREAYSMASDLEHNVHILAYPSITPQP